MVIMHPDWVNEVWKKTQEGNVLATDKQFDKYKLPIFFNVVISVTGLTNAEKNKIKTLVEENGGKHSGAFKSDTVDILILERNKSDLSKNDKFKAAVKYGKECLTPDWIYDSIKAGYSLPLKNYKVEVPLKASTPTKTLRSAIFNPDNTQLSMISNSSCGKALVLDETQMSTRSSILSNPAPGPSGFIRAKPKYQEVLAKMTVQMAKKAGTFLDGCCVSIYKF